MASCTASCLIDDSSSPTPSSNKRSICSNASLHLSDMKNLKWVDDVYRNPTTKREAFRAAEKLSGEDVGRGNQASKAAVAVVELLDVGIILLVGGGILIVLTGKWKDHLGIFVIIDGRHLEPVVQSDGQMSLHPEFYETSVMTFAVSISGTCASSHRASSNNISPPGWCRPCRRFPDGGMEVEKWKHSSHTNEGSSTPRGKLEECLLFRVYYCSTWERRCLEEEEVLAGCFRKAS